MPVYAIRCGDYVKIGTTSLATARHRLRQIQAMNPYPCTLVGVSRVTEAEASPLSVESWHHERLQSFHHWGEWYVWGQVAPHMLAYFLPMCEAAKKGGPPPRRLGGHKTRLRDAAKGRLGG